MRTGFYDLDRNRGPAAGDLIVLAARPSMGKTAFAINIIAENVAINEGLPVVIYSMEMGARSWRCGWWVPSAASTRTICAPAATDDEWSRLSEAVDKLGKRRHRSTRPRPHAQRRSAARARRQARMCGQLADHRRLPAADERQWQRQRREPRDRGGRDLARPEGAGQGTAGAGDRAVAAQPRREARNRQAADDERSARIRRHRAGCGHHHVHLPRRSCNTLLAAVHARRSASGARRWRPSGWPRQWRRRSRSALFRSSPSLRAQAGSGASGPFADPEEVDVSEASARSAPPSTGARMPAAPGPMPMISGGTLGCRSAAQAHQASRSRARTSRARRATTTRRPHHPPGLRNCRAARTPPG